MFVITMAISKAYSYIRFSRPEQIKGDTLRRQLDLSRKYANDHGLELDENLRDLGVSAYQGKNRTEGALSKFLKLVEAGGVHQGSYLLVESLDRLSREQILTALQLFLSIIDAGIVIVTLCDGHSYSKEKINTDFTPLLISLCIMQRAHEESRTKAMRLSAAWQNKRARIADQKLTARAPAWVTLSSDRQHFELVKSRAAVVRRIFDECASGLGKRLIAKNLNRDGISPFYGKRGWGHSSVQKILSNESVLGIFQPCKVVNGRRVPEGERVLNYYPPIISEDLYWRAKAANKERLVSGAGRKGNGYANMLSGIATCGLCGSKMVFVRKGRPPKGGEYLVCGSNRRGMCGNSTHFRYDTLEIELLRVLDKSFLDLTKIINPITGTCPYETKVSSLDGQILATQARLQKFLDEFETAEIPEVTKRIRDLGTQIKRLRKERDEVNATAKMEWAAKIVDQPNIFLEALALTRFAHERERFKIRAAMAQEYRRILKEITCYGPDKRVTVTLHTRTEYVARYIFLDGSFDHFVINRSDDMYGTRYDGWEIDGIRSEPDLTGYISNLF